MAYVSKEYYLNTFHGQTIPDAEFERLAQSASDVIDAVVCRPIDIKSDDPDMLSKAAAYQAELLYAQGGIDAMTGKAENQMAVTERLDDYSIQEARTDAANQKQLSINGVPVSAMTLSILRRMGLTSRWVYAGRRRPCGYGY